MGGTKCVLLDVSLHKYFHFYQCWQNYRFNIAATVCVAIIVTKNDKLLIIYVIPNYLSFLMSVTLLNISVNYKKLSANLNVFERDVSFI